MSIAIVGAAGSVGRALAAQCRQRGTSVVGLTRSGEPVDGHATIAAELGDPNALAAGMKGATSVVHVAGIANMDADAKSYAWTHVAGTENVLNAARAAGVKRVVILSCASVSLGSRDRVHWSEAKDQKQSPVFEHGKSKKVADELALAFSSDACEVIVLRAPWIWGSASSPRHAQLERESKRGGIVIPSTHGDFFATLHIDNCVDAILAALEAPSEREGKLVAGEAYYVADEEPHNVAEFFSAYAQAMSWNAPVFRANWQLWLGARFSGAPVLSLPAYYERKTASLFDTQRARTMLGWSPRTHLAAGMAKLKLT